MYLPEHPCMLQCTCIIHSTLPTVAHEFAIQLCVLSSIDAAPAAACHSLAHIR
jgi:hypothetical protein